LQTDKPLSAYGPLAQAAEAYGFDGVSVYQDMLYQPAWLPLLEIARHTHRVWFGPAAVNPFTCHPLNIAGHIALLDEASQGRAYLGLARGAWLERITRSHWNRHCCSASVLLPQRTISTGQHGTSQTICWAALPLRGHRRR
jgi:alkanesulfonate monooxygenase SsuD/methylene tetrahydromethanopterin reductase-like flavin-dependent oxidoreductase (luciferase family)